MNLYKFNFDLGGSANTAQYVTIPTDSKYSLGIGFTKNGKPVDIGGATVMLEDDLYQYDPKEILNNRAIFAGQTGGTAGEAKTYAVKYHENAKEPDELASYEGYLSATYAISFTAQQLVDICGPRWKDLDWRKLYL